MPRGACTFKQRDVQAAVKAVRAAGCEVERVEVDKDGRITVITNGKAQEPAPNEWDKDGA